MAVQAYFRNAFFFFLSQLQKLVLKLMLLISWILETKKMQSLFGRFNWLDVFHFTHQISLMILILFLLIGNPSKIIF